MTSKPSSTNSPSALPDKAHSPRAIPLLASLLSSGQCCIELHARCHDMAQAETNSGGFGPGVPPLPIPNREVKPGRADGTAPQCGRVGRRLLSGALRTIMWRAPFFCPSFCVPLQRPGGASRQLLRVGQAALAVQEPRALSLSTAGSRCACGRGTPATRAELAEKQARFRAPYMRRLLLPEKW